MRLSLLLSATMWALSLGKTVPKIPEKLHKTGFDRCEFTTGDGDKASVEIYYTVVPSLLCSMTQFCETVKSRIRKETIWKGSRDVYCVPEWNGFTQISTSFKYLAVTTLEGKLAFGDPAYTLMTQVNIIRHAAQLESIANEVFAEITKLDKKSLPGNKCKKRKRSDVFG